MRAIVTWSLRNDVQQETIRRANCTLPLGAVWVLGRVAKDGPVRPSDVAAVLGVDKSTITPRAQRLERARLIVRRPDPSDRRASLLQVTSAGRRVLSRLHIARRAMLEELTADWTESQRLQTASAISRLAGRLEEGWEVTAGT